MFGLFQGKEGKIRRIGKKMLKDAIFWSSKAGGEERILGHLDRIYELGGGEAVRSQADRVLITLKITGAPDKMEFMFRCCRAWADRDRKSRYEVFGYS
jgi:hypothetical protein